MGNLRFLVHQHRRVHPTDPGGVASRHRVSSRGYAGIGHDLRATQILSCLKQIGYVVFHKESNNMAGGGLIEYAFLRLDISFQHVPDEN